MEFSKDAHMKPPKEETNSKMLKKWERRNRGKGT
jgi:hypothetical protein